MPDSDPEDPDGDGVEEFVRAHDSKDAGTVENLAWLLRIIPLLLEYMPDCAIKGGMAVLLNLRDGGPYRVSRDIDVETGMSRRRVIVAMRHISDGIDGLDLRLDPPRGPAKGIPMLRFRGRYRSRFGGGTIKVEVFYGSDTAGAVEVRAPGYAVPISGGFLARIYGPGHLIGIKMTTLALGTVGIRDRRMPEIPKHVYDIACLLKHLPGNVRIGDIADSLKKTVDTELSYLGDGGPSADDVLDDLSRFPGDLFPDGTRPGSQYEGWAGIIASDMLERRYPISEHVADVLLVRAVIGLALRRLRGGDPARVEGDARELLGGLAELSGMDRKAKGMELRRIRAASGAGDLMDDMSPEQAYVYGWMHDNGMA